MSTLGGTMTMKATPATTPAAPAAPAVPPAAPAVETPAATTTQKSSSETLDFGVERELVDPLNDGNWPLDLNERAPLAKDAFSVKPKTA
jgi:hypothetical protein